jgi:spore maturation protein CgeB
MERQIERLLADSGLRERLALHGWSTIVSRHTCGHRVDELLAIVARLRHDHDAVRREAAPAVAGESVA